MHGRILIKLSLLCFIVIQNIKDARDECLLPRHPPSGRWSMPNNKFGLMPKVVPEYTMLRIECHQSYILEGCSIVACLNGTWTPNIGQCSKICPPIYSTATKTVKCTAKGKKTNCTDAVEGTKAYFMCAPFYENDDNDDGPAICTNGSWSKTIPDCHPECGKILTKRISPLLVGGKSAKPGQFPWQVAFYHKDKSFFCGGSLLNERLILTAAHCITDDNGKILPKEDYLVAVGKYYIEYNHSGDLNYSQTSAVQDMFVPNEYAGSQQKYMGDIALIVTVKTFKLSERVQPVCIDWNKKYENDILNSDQSKMGFVSGWGFTREDSSHPSKVLRQLKVPAISNKKCKKELPEAFRNYVTYDKFCAGYLNNGSSACVGDGGGGLVFENNNTFYIAGVVSLVIPSKKLEYKCNSNHYGLYTVVYNYTDKFILPKWNPPEPSIDDDSKCKSCTTATPPQDKLVFTKT